MARALDTEPWADEMQIRLIRAASPAKRLDLAFQLSAMVWNGVRAAIDRKFAGESRDERDRRFLAELYGSDLADAFIAFRRSAHAAPENQDSHAE